MTCWIEMLGAMLDNGVNTILLIKARVISGYNSWFLQCNWGAAHAHTQVRSGDCFVFLVTLTQGKGT